MISLLLVLMAYFINLGNFVSFSNYEWQILSKIGIDTSALKDREEIRITHAHYGHKS